MIRKGKNIAASVCMAAVLLFSASSCGILEMRDATKEISSDEETQNPVLNQAERYNEVEKAEDTVSANENKENTEGTETDTASQEKRINMTVVGGIAIDSRINTDAASRADGEKGYSFLTMYASVYPYIHNADVALATLETPCADTDVYPVTSETVLNMPAESLTALADLGFDIINTAGTNVNSCGDEGIQTTVEKVCDTEMLQIGAYQDELDANDIRVCEQDGVRIAFLSLMEEAPESTMVIPDLGDLTAVQGSISYADLISDVVVVSVTWNGTDRGNRKEAAKNLADFGADIIVGCDGASLGEAEWIVAEDGTKTFVAYSLGNLITDGTDAESLLGGILEVDIVARDNNILLENITITPVVTHCTEQNAYQVMELKNYSEDMAAAHSVDGITAENLMQIAASKIPAEFLSNE